MHEKLSKIYTDLKKAGLTTEQEEIIRRELDDGRYNIGDSLDEAIDRVLEELIADG